MIFSSFFIFSSQFIKSSDIFEVSNTFGYISLKSQTPQPLHLLILQSGVTTAFLDFSSSLKKYFFVTPISILSQGRSKSVFLLPTNESISILRFFTQSIHVS